MNDHHDCTNFEKAFKTQLAERCRNMQVNDILVRNHGCPKSSEHLEAGSTKEVGRDSTMAIGEDVACAYPFWNTSKFSLLTSEQSAVRRMDQENEQIQRLYDEHRPAPQTT
jgi:hypothetical protein